MEEILKAAFAEDVSLRDFFMDHMPRIHEANLEDFKRWTDETLIISFEMRDTDERYTLACNPSDCEVEDDEMIDFPIITLVGEARHWDALKPSLLELALALNANAEKLEAQYNARIERKMLDEFERKFEGTITAVVVGVEGIDEPVTFELVLNDYVKNDGAPGFEFRINASNIRDLANGKVKPKELKDTIKVVGQMKLALDMLGFFSTHFEI